MNISYQYLTSDCIPELHKCLMESFSDYPVDMSYMTRHVMEKRIILDRVDFSYSVGAYYQNRMIGFIVIGIDNYRNELYAFDAGTGIVPNYRGKGVAGRMFELVVKKLKESRINKISLEVLQKNKNAIKAYNKSGFEIVDSYNAYRIKIDNSKKRNVINSIHEIKTIQLEDILELTNYREYEPAWEYTNSAMQANRDDIEIFGAELNGEIKAYIAYHAGLNWIFCIGTHPELRGSNVYSILISHLLNHTNGQLIKFNNIPEGHHLNQVLLNYGFEKYTSQFEMLNILD